MRRKLFNLLGLAAAIASAVYFLLLLSDNIVSLPPLHYDWRLASTFLVVVGSVLIAHFVQVVAVHVLLRGLGAASRFKEVLPIILLSQFAKYLPGNIGHFVGRVAVGEKYGYSVQRLFFTLGYEIGWVVIVAASIVLTTVMYAGNELSANRLPRLPSVWVLSLFVATIVTMPPLGSIILNRWRPKFLARWLGDGSLGIPALSVTSSCMLLYVAIFAINGLGLAILAEGITGKGLTHVVLLIGMFATAWLAGFVVPGAPGGLGIREAILVTSLSPLYGEPAAVALTLASRVCFIFGDGLAFLIGLFAYRASPPSVLASEGLEKHLPVAQSD